MESNAKQKYKFFKAILTTVIGLLQGILKKIKIKTWFIRKHWLNVHLFLALSIGLIFAVLGFTGSILVYREEIDEWLNPQLVVEKIQDDYLSLDQIMDSVRTAHPDRDGEWTLEMPRSANGMVTAWFDKPRESYFERYAPLMVSVNPYTAEVVASRFWGQTATTWLLDLHTQLQYGQAGWNFVGYCGLGLLLSVTSGLYLWWPKTKNFTEALKIRATSWVRLLFDLHRMLGSTSAVALIILAFTGVHLSFPSVLEKLVGSTGMAHGETGRTIVSTAIPNDHPTLLEASEFIARSPFPKADLRRVTTPDGKTGVYRVNLRQKGEVNVRHPYTTVWVDRWSGQIKEVRNPATFSTGETLLTWMWPLHTGEALGSWGRFCWFLSGQSLCFLYFSGLVRWLHKKGVIRDRKITTKRLTIDTEKLKQFAFRLLTRTQMLIVRSAKSALTAIKQLTTMLSNWLERCLILYQAMMKNR